MRRSLSYHGRLFVTLMLILVAALPVGARQQAINVTGRAVPALKPFDDLMTNFLRTHGVPGASLCIARNGRILYARGFGFADRDTGKPVDPHALFRIASVSKPITAAAIMRLIQTRKLKLDDNPFRVLGYVKRLRDDDIDPRFSDITIEHLLHHTAGWNREQTYDPMFQYTRISEAMSVPKPPSQQAIIEYMIAQPLQSNPGMKYAYSNFGYCVLGRVIEKVTGKTYEKFVQKEILAPLGITTMQIGGSLPEDRVDFEVRYYDAKDATGTTVLESGRIVPRPYVIDHEVMDSHGAWIASASDLVKIAIALGKPDNRLLNRRSLQAMFRPPPGPPGHDPDGSVKTVYYACGWNVRPTSDHSFNFSHTGRINGTASRLAGESDGWICAVLFNCDISKVDDRRLADLIGTPLYNTTREVMNNEK